MTTLTPGNAELSCTNRVMMELYGAFTNRGAWVFLLTVIVTRAVFVPARDGEPLSLTDTVS